MRFRFGTRGSALALWQTRHVMALLTAAQPDIQAEYEIIVTRGDQIVDTPLPLIGGKGVFTAELEAALRDGRIDAAVHSLKDLPTDAPEGLIIGAIPARGSAADALISREGYTLATLPAGARVGTSSPRRKAQLLHRRPDLQVIDIRGNVDTRLRKALAVDGDYDALVLAQAGLERLGRLEAVSEVLAFADMLPAPGQGALAAQCRADAASRARLTVIDDAATRAAVTAERAFLAGLGGGCSVPVAAYGAWERDQLWLRGRVTAPDGSRQIDVETRAPIPVDPLIVGIELAARALNAGARALIERQP